MMDFNAIIDAAHEATDKHGVPVQRGKKYSQVVTRVELFKRHLPEWGLDTTVIHLGLKPGDPVVVKAIVTDESGRVKGAGTAGEIIGAGNVNKTSALENAETSAIGRALASIGIAGGEYASLNEVEGAQRKEEAQQENIEEARIARDRQRLEAAENLDTLAATFGVIYHEWHKRPPAELVELKNELKAKFPEPEETEE